MSPTNGGGLAGELRAALATCEARVRELVERPPVGFRATVLAFDRLTEPLNGLSGRASLLAAVHPDRQVRTTCEELEQEVSRFVTSLGLNRDLFERLAAVSPGDDEEEATPEELRLFEEALRDFRRGGVDRDEETRDRIRALREELVAIGQEFDRNVIEGGREVVVEDGHAGLAGLPADFLRTHPEREDGTVLLTTDHTDRVPVMTWAEDVELRRRYYRAFYDRAAPENLPVLERLLEKRHELASLLGYRSWADYVTEDKMSGSAAEVRSFLERVVALTRARAVAETRELEEEKRALGEAGPLRDYERAFLLERIRRRRFSFDSQEVRRYFPYGRVRDGVLATTARLYGVTFRRVEDAGAWHESVETYELVEDGEVRALLHLDMHPREGKYKGGAMYDVSAGASPGVLPEAALVCNFPAPTEDDPGLLQHEDVTTLFHEVGHLMHHLFAGRQRHLTQAGIATEFDFVEVPSQLYEEWGWRPDVLATFARHVETGEPIPGELVERMRAADDHGRAMQVLGQMFFALLSLDYHDRDPAGLDTTARMVALRERLLTTPHEEGTFFQASFGHLNGYSALYYTYMWSLVIAKDLYSVFERDPMDGATAARYRGAVLARGGSRPARELVREFLGRDSGFDAFERWLAPAS